MNYSYNYISLSDLLRVLFLDDIPSSLRIASCETGILPFLLQKVLYSSNTVKTSSFTN